MELINLLSQVHTSFSSVFFITFTTELKVTRHLKKIVHTIYSCIHHDDGVFRLSINKFGF